MLRDLVLMLDHDFPDWCLFHEIKLVDSLIEQLIVNAVKRDDDLGADRLDYGFLVGLTGIHRLGNVLQTLDVKVGLVA